MTPDPTPVLGMSVPNTPVSPLPVVVVILTTAGPAFAAASMTADDSSMVTGTCAPVGCVAPAWVVVAVRSSTPARSRTTTVPPAARTADSREAVTTVPTPAPPRRRGVAGWTGAAYAGGGADVPPAGAPHAGEYDDAGGSAGAGCDQRSCCAPGPVEPADPEPGEAHAQRASGRGSGAGE